MFLAALRHRAPRFALAAAGAGLCGAPARAAPPSEAAVAAVEPTPVPTSATPASTAPAVVQSSSGELDPGSPMRELPGMGVDWPDLNAVEATQAAPAATSSAPATTTAAPSPRKPRPNVDAAAAERYTVTIEGIDGLGGDLRSRFEQLSSLHQGQGKPANVAQIDRRAREDAEVLRELLRADGYYDAEVDTRIDAGATPAERLDVHLIAAAGGRYRFTEVSLPGLEAAGADAAPLRNAFAIKPDDPVDADTVTAAQAALKTALGQRGYVFADLAAPRIVVDHDTHGATLELPITPNGARQFGKFELRGKRLFSAHHIGEIARLRPGDRFDARRIDDLRRALVATGLVSSVQLTPVPTADPQIADLAVRIEAAPPRTIAGEIGYGTGEGASIEVNWQHRNFFPPEGAVTLRGVLGTQEQLLSAQLRRGNFHARDEILTGQIAFDHQKRQAYEARTFTLAAGIERQTNIIWQKKWTWSVGGELITSDERDVVKATGAPRRRTYFIGAVPGSLAYDGSDDLLNPTRGYRVALRVSPELSFQNGTFGYVKAQFDASGYQPVGQKLVLAGRVRLGSIVGPQAGRIAPSRRFYSGGGGSVRGYGYQDIGPRDIDNDPVGGKSLAEFALEARVRFGSFGVVPFLDGGNLYRGTTPSFGGLQYGAGLGARYYTSFGPIRVDLGTPLNPRKGDPRVTVYVSLGQAF